MTLKKATFILNPISGINRRPAKIIFWIEKHWGNNGIEIEILKTGHRGHGTELARKAAQQGSDLVVAAGGDGTINEVGQGLIGSNTALGIIPAGSGNGFARNLNIPLKQEMAIALLRNPLLKKIDVGKINEHYFFNIAGSGIDAQVSLQFDRSRLRGFLPYLFLSLREFLRYRGQQVTIKLPDRVLRREPLLLSFANLPEFGNRATIAPGARPDDGLLDICILNPISMGKLLRSLPLIFSGKIDQLSEMEIYRASKATISRPHSAPIHTDGDPHQEGSKLNIELLPEHLTIALPQPSKQPVGKKRWFSN